MVTWTGESALISCQDYQVTARETGIRIQRVSIGANEAGTHPA